MSIYNFRSREMLKIVLFGVLGSKPGTSPIFNISSSNTPARKIGADDFLNSDNDKNDYDW